MADSQLKQKITDDMKAAMRAKEQAKLSVIRLILAAIKQKEVDERIELTDEQVLAILNKMAKQRGESITQFQSAGRTELVEQEEFELSLIKNYLPEQLSEQEIQAIITDAIANTGAKSIRDMGKVMGVLKNKLQGRADMAAVSKLIKSQLELLNTTQ